MSRRLAWVKSWLRSLHHTALGAVFRKDFVTAECRGNGGRRVHRWVHAETRNPICWGPRSWHWLGGLCARVGSGGEESADFDTGKGGKDEAKRVSRWEGSHLYGLLRDL